MVLCLFQSVMELLFDQLKCICTYSVCCGLMGLCLRGGDKIQVEIYIIYTCTCKSSCDLKLETFSCLLNALSNDSGFGS